MRKLAAYLKKHPSLYLSLDDDEAGQKALRLAAKLLGPKVQIVHMSRAYTREDAAADQDRSEGDNAKE